jgi:hypothetical protein
MLCNKRHFKADRLYDHLKNWEQIYGIPTNKSKTYDEQLLEIIGVYCALETIICMICARGRDCPASQPPWWLGGLLLALWHLF